MSPMKNYPAKSLTDAETQQFASKTRISDHNTLIQTSIHRINQVLSLTLYLSTGRLFAPVGMMAEHFF